MSLIQIQNQLDWNPLKMMPKYITQEAFIQSETEESQIKVYCLIKPCRD